LIDSARHFHPVDVIKRNLDGLAAVKMNVLHWHLTEDQGFRVESKVFPALHRLGSDGLFYSQDQIRDIIAYAADRGIRVMPEFDLPGHSTSWFPAFPELASAPGPYRISRTYGVQLPAFNPANSQVYVFLDAFLGEMAGLFPDPYIHIGGDENNGKHWDANPEIQAFMKEKGLADNAALQAYFNGRLFEILAKHGRKMVGWDEIFQPELSKDVVIQSWRGTEALVQAARRGYAGLLSNGYYVDLCYSAADHYLNDPLPPDTAFRRPRRPSSWAGRRRCGASWSRPRRSIRASGRGRRPSPNGSGRRPTPATWTTCTGGWNLFRSNWKNWA
jgi:N-acetyl-beta-hexosaminidase